MEEEWWSRTGRKEAGSHHRVHRNDYRARRGGNARRPLSIRCPGAASGRRKSTRKAAQGEQSPGMKENGRRGALEREQGQVAQSPSEARGEKAQSPDKKQGRKQTTWQRHGTGGKRRQRAKLPLAQNQLRGETLPPSEGQRREQTAAKCKERITEVRAPNDARADKRHHPGATPLAQGHKRWERQHQAEVTQHKARGG